MSLNVIERTREIGVMRAIGAPTGSVLNVVLSEGLVIGILGWLLGIIVSYPMSVGLTRAVGEAFFEGPIQFSYSFVGAAGWLALVLAISALAAVIPASSASRITVREALAYE
jgi:putative ABC transport system permease protein